jgi:hypothetical protein
MSAFSPNPEEHFNAETIETLRQALQAALQQPVSPWNRETQGPFHAGRLLHEPVSVAEGGPGTKSNPIDLTATTSSTSSCRSFSVGSHSGLRSSMGMDAFQEPDESPSPERARRSVERSRSRSWDAETQESLASGSFADFDALEASGVGLPTLWGNEQEYSESRDEEDEFTPASDHSPERMWLKEDNDLAITDDEDELTSASNDSPVAINEDGHSESGVEEHDFGVEAEMAQHGTPELEQHGSSEEDENVWPNISLISQTMRPLVGVIIPVRVSADLSKVCSTPIPC